MKHHTCLSALAALLLGALPAIAAPPLINYQGRIAVEGVNFEGTGHFKFALVDGGVNQNVQATAFVPGTAGSLFFIGVMNPGSGYVAAPAVTITDSTGTGATATAMISPEGQVTSIQVTNGGSGYSLTPTVTIDPPPPNIVTTTFWSNDQSSANGSEPGSPVLLPVVKGLYSVLLGDNSLGATMRTLGASDFANPDVRLRVWFSDDGTTFQLLAPDQRLAPAVYLADGSVRAATIEDQAITGVKIADDAITAAKVADGAITAEAISTNQINVSHLVVQPTAPGQVLGHAGGDIAWVPGGGVFALNGTNAFYNGGRVGIGTQTPAGALQVANGGLAITGSSSPFTGAGQGLFLERNGATGGVFAFNYTDFTPMPLLLNSPGGTVGIGTSNPATDARLDVRGSTTLRGLDVSAEWNPNAVANINLTGSKPTLRWTGIDNTSGFPERSWIAHVGYDSSLVGTTGLQFYTRRRTLFPSSDSGWQIAATLDTDGSLDLVGDLSCKSLTIRGADVAEPFDIVEQDLPKGTVVVIDATHHGRLKRSTVRYDTCVAGIVSGANGIDSGIILSQPGVNEGGQNVAISGRVYVQADATGAPIKAGDLLTTSDIPGHAMKVTEHARAQGAVIGKAMSSLEEGTGMVLVLVTLQ